MNTEIWKFRLTHPLAHDTGKLIEGTYVRVTEWREATLFVVSDSDLTVRKENVNAEGEVKLTEEHPPR